MPDRMKISDEITVGAQPSEAELKAMADGGTKSIVSLRTDDEEMQRISPQEEGELARSFGMEYVNIPVDMENASPDLVDRFRDALDDLPKPAYVHCRLGKQAGAFTMMDQAVRKGMTGEELLEAAQNMGFECDDQSMVEFVKSYVDSKTGT